MPDTKITLFAQHPVKIAGKCYCQEEFEVASRQQADALIECGAAVDGAEVAAAPDEVALAEAEKAEAEKKAASKRSTKVKGNAK